MIWPPAAVARVAPAGVALALAAMPAAAADKCKPGVHKHGAVQAFTFCGAASATISISSHRTTLRRGSCERSSNGFKLHIGTILLGVDSPSRPDYFGMTVGRPAFNAQAPRDGTYTGNTSVTFVIRHERYSIRNPTVRLAAHRTEGSFSGRLLQGGHAAGTFRCG